MGEEGKQTYVIQIVSQQIEGFLSWHRGQEAEQWILKLLQQ